MKSTQKNFEKAFYSDGYKLGMKAVQSGISKLSLFSAIKELYAAINGLNDSLTTFAKKRGNPIDCKKGCEWCCHQPIFALSYEMEYLNDFLKTNFDKTSQNEISIRAEKKNTKLKTLLIPDLLNSKFPCPLLQNGFCISYEARPMACRIYLSTNANTCLAFYKKPENEDAIPALLDFPMRAGRMMNEGFKAALKMGGLATKEFRIEETLLVTPIKLSGLVE